MTEARPVSKPTTKLATPPNRRGRRFLVVCLQWVLVLPTAYTCVVITILVLVVALLIPIWIAGMLGIRNAAVDLLVFAASAIGSANFVTGGSRMAPVGRRPVAIVLALFAFLTSFNATFEFTSLETVIIVICSACGSLYGVLKAHRRETFPP